MKILAYLQSAAHLATAIFLSVCALAVIAGLCTFGYNYWERSQAKGYEELQQWNVDLSSHLQFSLVATTKLVDRGFHLRVQTNTYPAYLKQVASSPRYNNAEIILNFLDKDGFKVFSKRIFFKDFSTVVDTTGEPIALMYETNDQMEVKTYASMAKMDVLWTLDVAALNAEKSTAFAEEFFDHCAPNISKAERLKRLAQYGEVRQTSDGTFESGSHSVSFLSFDNSLLNCR